MIQPATAVGLHHRYPFRSAGLDFATQGGVPRGHITILFGGAGYGKTTGALLALAEFFRQDDRYGLYLQSDYKWDRMWFADLGGDVDRLKIVDGDALEVSFDLVTDIIRNPKDQKKEEIGFIVIDSMRAMTTSAEYAREFSAGPGQQAPEATVTNKFFRKVNEFLAARRVQGSPVTLLIINHETHLPPVRPGLAPAKTMPFGKQQQYAQHLRVEFLKPIYANPRTIMGTEVEQLVQLRFRVPRQVEGPAVKAGATRIWQLPGERPKGFVDDLSEWWEMGKTSAIIAGHDGKHPKWVIGNEEPVEMHSLDIIEERWAKNRDLYLRDQDLILPAVLKMFFHNADTKEKGEP